MSKRDLNDENSIPNMESDPSLSENMYELSNIFDSVDLSEFEFEEDADAYHLHHGNGQNKAEPSASPIVQESSEDFSYMLDDDNSFDTYVDSGAYRSYDGSSEYRSFDAAMPDAPEEHWYHYSDEDSRMDNEVDDEEAPESEDDEYDDYYDDEPEVRHRGLKIFGNMLMVFIALLGAFYLMVLYSGIPFLTNLRDIYVRSAMSTLSHKWLATAIVPSDIIDELMLAQYQSEQAAEGIESNDNWSHGFETNPTLMENAPASSEEDDRNEADSAEGDYGQYESEEEKLFFEFFHELDYESTKAYLDKHPDVIKDGYYYLDINEAGLKDEGTSIKTKQGDQVLAINSQQGVLLIRIDIGGTIDRARGVIAICKDTSRVTLRSATTLPATGQTCGKICENNDGILAITASAFWDPNGTGNGGIIDGLAVCNGKTMGERLGSGYKRIELRDDNYMYIVDSNSSVGSGTRDAAEMQPALIVDGKVVVDSNNLYNGQAPRAVLGQTSKQETMMVVTEGRMASCPGCGVDVVAEKMAEYDCYQALNMDGGTSAIMYFDGEPVTKCNNDSIPNGRTIPTAWVYLSAK